MEWLDLVYAGNSVRGYLVALGVVVAGAILASVARRICARSLAGWAARTKTPVDDAVLRLIHWPLYSVLVIVGAYLAVSSLVTPSWVQTLFYGLLVLSTALVVAVALSRITDIFFETTLQRLVDGTSSRMDDQAVPVLRRTAKGTLWTVALLLVLDNFGYDVMALIAGLGLGGLALAMASRDTLSNVLGGVTIFVDAPFQVGDTVGMTGVRGEVEEVGLRTTRVRTVEGHLVTIPNSAAATSIIENVSARPTTRVSFPLGLARETSLAKCREAVDLVQAAIGQVEGVEGEPTVEFSEFLDARLGFQVAYHVARASSLGAVKHEVNLRIKEALEGAGI